MPAESRNEAILQAMLDGTPSSALEPPQSRIETLLQAVLDKMNEGGGGASALTELSDVDLDNPSNGQIIQYDATSGKWKNVSAAGGGLVVTKDETNTMDKTWKEIYDAYSAGQFVAFVVTDGDGVGVTQHQIFWVGQTGSTYYVGYYNPETSDFVPYTTDSENGYPQYQLPD